MGKKRKNLYWEDEFNTGKICRHECTLAGIMVTSGLKDKEAPDLFPYPFLSVSYLSLFPQEGTHSG